MTDPDLAEKRRKGYTVDTLGVLIDHGYKVALYCENPRDGLTCGFVKWLDLEKLAAKLGRDHSCLRDDLVPNLFCTKCGGKKVSIRLHPYTGPRD
ncbi:hypothetical protein [Aerobium aerolatum]|uniref:Uncharacterized protein n=1 Tax=Aquamicrobium aerolatum DSM 21857 TaxID=1121003 RepID=A0A1I3L8L0_9HYPH|nr:hypothetical protein [Aquamicrobium aerolatum]SFI81047.1 hypothetical protein SAMN03080618_01425 [Aquamicrobium aerolatum DSM 21857]